MHSEEIKDVIIFTPFFSHNILITARFQGTSKTICSVIRDSKQSDDLVKKIFCQIFNGSRHFDSKESLSQSCVFVYCVKWGLMKTNLGNQNLLIEKILM